MHARWLSALSSLVLRPQVRTVSASASTKPGMASGRTSGRSGRKERGEGGALPFADDEGFSLPGSVSTARARQEPSRQNGKGPTRDQTRDCRSCPDCQKNAESPSPAFHQSIPAPASIACTITLTAHHRRSSPRDNRRPSRTPASADCRSKLHGLGRRPACLACPALAARERPDRSSRPGLARPGPARVGATASE